MEPRTHYQISLTSRQALSLFIGLLAVLALSYFLGLMTGLAGRDAPGTAESQIAGNASEIPPPTPEPAEGTPPSEHLAFPVPVTAAPSAGGPAPAPPAVIQGFEDGGGPAPPRPPPASGRSVTPRPQAATGGFRVQVLSVSSRADAEAEAGRLTRQGLPARVEPGTGPRGTIYRVRVGPYATRAEAEMASRRLSLQGRRDTWIVAPAQ